MHGHHPRILRISVAPPTTSNRHSSNRSDWLRTSTTNGLRLGVVTSEFSGSPVDSAPSTDSGDSPESAIYGIDGFGMFDMFDGDDERRRDDDQMSRVSTTIPFSGWFVAKCALLRINRWCSSRGQVGFGFFV